VSWADEVTRLDEPVVVAPWVDIGRPVGVPAISGGRRFEFDVRCCDEASYNRAWLTHGGKTLWEVVFPGGHRGFELPDLAAVHGAPVLPPGASLRWSLLRVLRARPFEIDHYTWRDLGGLWLSYASSDERFDHAGP
jgi:hypothetical protein